MLGISLAMLIGSALLMLRLSPGGSFPSPLSQEEEKKYLTQWQNGDISSRNVLVEHNLRLVAHIIKKILYADKRYRRPYIHRNYRAYKGYKYL